MFNTVKLKNFILNQHSKLYTILLLGLLLTVQLVPTISWALNPKYDLLQISNQLKKIKGNPIIIGDWAPQLCINTPHRVLYSVTTKNMSLNLNFSNLADIKANYLVIVDGLNDNMIDQINITYQNPIDLLSRRSHTYANKNISIYQMNF